MTPPQNAIDAAIVAANNSPCAKSKRGVAVYEQFTSDGSVWVQGAWFNGPPEPYRCGGDAACREACPKICVHAEMRALLEAHRGAMAGDEARERVRLVHVKTENGVLVPGGGPSCWQCSRLLLDLGFAGIWLYQATFENYDGFHIDDVAWIFYTAREFHEMTLRACNLPRFS